MKILNEIKQDFKDQGWIYIIVKYFMSKGLQAVISFRISSFFYQQGHYTLAKIVKNHCIRVTGADIAEAAKICEGFSIGHPVGIVVGGSTSIGRNCFILSGVVLGSKSNLLGEGRIKIGDNAYLGTGCKIIGDIHVGNNVTIGANSVVIEDIPDNAICVGVPGKVRLCENSIC